jgi:Kef-type K+ transport system membrane component KefB/mannitol/fructose-specific phosphotransferase system IIA component (Ntr-type)
MTDREILVLLLALGAMLGLARGLGALARSRGMPAIAGEVAAGVLLGPTVLGRVAPGLHARLFGAAADAGLDAITTVAVVLLLVAAGLHVDLRVLRRRGRVALPTAALGIVLPAVGGLALGFLLPAANLVDPSRRPLVAALLAVALAVSALPVVAKTIEAGLFKSDVGLLVTAAASIDELVGWPWLALLLGPVRGAVVFATFAAGLVARAARLSPRAQSGVDAIVSGFFAPLFFASVGLRADFAAAFDPVLCLVVLLLASVPKVLGCALGARFAGLRWREATAVGTAMNARGAMGFIVAALALDAGLVRASTFEALVLMSLVTSLASGPALRWLLYASQPEEDVVTLLRRGAFVSELHATTPGDAIAELVRALGSLIKGMKRDARDAVLERELVAPTGLGDEVAIPHAAIDGLDRPQLALGLAPRGIDFGALDGRPSRIVFLLLMPAKAYDAEVRILASIARATYDARARDELSKATTVEEAARVLARSAKRTRESMRPKSMTTTR